jgi:prepilin-type processing-associated H-X9-DG protein
LNNFRRFVGSSFNNPPGVPYPFIADKSLQANPTDPATGIVVPLNECFGGPHSGVCNFVLCDGSVRGVSVDLSIDVLTRLGLPSDGQPVSFDP